MNQGLINRDSRRIINNSFGKYEESEDSGQNLYTNISNIYIYRERNDSTTDLFPI